MNYAKHRKAIETLYDSTCTISRYTGSKKASGETRLNSTPEVIYANKSCRISQKALGSNKQTDVENKILYEIKLIIAPELEIRQGDIVTVTTKQGRIQTYTAGEPFPPYPTHQEISLQREGKA